jgi:Ca-activated chloride channel homolog
MERYLLILLLPLLMGSCAPYVSHWRVLKGNYDYVNGRYQPATVAYLGILEDGHERDEIIHYNLGNVFYALGETSAADEEWSLALETDDGELLFRTLFNQGNLYFELSQYANAYSRFREALTIRPDSLEAKRNLELVLLKLSSQQEQPQVRTEGSVVRGEEPGEDVERILQYIKRKEESQWVSQRSEEPVSDGPYW